MVFFESASENLPKTRTLFLRIVAISYCMAFTSLYPQIRGLYGDDGILPVAAQVEKITNWSWNQLLTKPSILGLAPVIGLSADLWIELLCLLGAIVGLIASLLPTMGNKIVFIILWMTYFSIYNVGQTFLWFQWDILLLETGFLAIVAAPFSAKNYQEPKPRDHISMMLVRWLLFRMMFASGVVKLQSKCPTWWGLTAMPIHYESQCIPTSLAWYAYNAQPEGSFLHKLSVVVTYLTEIPLTFYFFAPTKTLRKIAFAFQLQLMVAIMLTGNYNFFNILYIGLCVSLMDDSWFKQRSMDDSSSNDNESSNQSRIADVIGKGINFLFVGILVYFTAIYFFKYENYSVHIAVRFTKSEFATFVSNIGSPYGIMLGGMALTCSFIISLYKSIPLVNDLPFRRHYIHFVRLLMIFDDLLDSTMIFQTRLWNMCSTLLHGLIALMLFGISLPVFTRGVGQSVPNFASSLMSQPLIKQGMKYEHDLQLVSSYGLFRSMTGVGGRPEVVIEGSMTEHGPWKEYDFLYKPGNLSEAPRLCLPHQPRLDWQMWFAALSNYQQSYWTIPLAYRILQGILK